MGNYVNGSNMLLYVDNKAYGHCTTHTTTMTSETKERAVKPAASVTATTGLWKQKGVVALGISISGEGLVFNGETEQAYGQLMKLWKQGKSIKAKCMERGQTDKPYLSGSFVITNLERTDPAQDDASHSIKLENDGEPDVLDESAFSDADEDSPSE